MISEFILVNETTQKELKFGQDIDCDCLYGDGGLDWGSVGGTHSTYNYPNQVGASISHTKLNSRDISIEGYVYYIISEGEATELNRNDRINYCYEKIKEKKALLNEIINPNDFIKLIIGDYYIEGKPNASIIYGNVESENNLYFCKFMFSLFCANPMFKKNTISRTKVQGSTGNFKFPLALPQEGIILSERHDYLLISVNNEGGVPIGGRIIITARGVALNPQIENLNTNEIIKINKQMVAGETITINTSDGAERGIIGEIGGVKSNYLQYWNFSNKWFKFNLGTTLLGYSTDDSSENLLDITVEINPEKFSLEEM